MSSLWEGVGQFQSQQNPCPEALYAMKAATAKQAGNVCISAIRFGEWRISEHIIAIKKLTSGNLTDWKNFEMIILLDGIYTTDHASKQQLIS